MANKRETRLLVLQKITKILDCFTPEEPVLGLSAIRALCGLPESTCQRLVQNLVREGLLDHTRGGYRVGFAVARWAVAAKHGIDVVESSRSILQSLRDETQESAILYLRSRHQRTVAACATPARAISRVLEVGMTMPLHLGSAGKVFLAFDKQAEEDVRINTPDAVLSQSELEKARLQGWYATFEEREKEVSSVSAPVFDFSRSICAVVGIVAPSSRLNADTIGAEHVRPVLKAAELLSARLGLITS